ncbi:uncharacterized protein LOC135399222 [Ornithodoros turicata]|uniref:uncharacterized protein LOC135399222 n=1 Tax=Ornithodoros turicata TaxID=34597 RepID=UPI003138EF2B
MGMSVTTEESSGWNEIVRDFAENTSVLQPDQICTRVRNLGLYLVQQGVSLADSRKHLTVKDLTVINKVIRAAGVLLAEGRSGFEVIRANDAEGNDVSEESLVDAAFLFCWLLRTKLNVTSVDIRGTLLLTRVPFVLKLGLSSNNGVRKIKVGLWEDKTEVHGTYLAQGLHVGLPLEVFYSRGLQLTNAAAVRIANVLRSCNGTLEDVFISTGPVGGPDQDHVIFLLEALAGCFKLNSLFVAGYYLGKDGGEILAKVLRTNPSLKKVTLRRANDDAMLAVMEGLHTNTSLESLEMSENCSLSCNVASVVADVMKVDGSIRNLNLKALNVDDAGAKALASMLSVNSTLKELNLEYNSITEEGAASFADAISKNTSLEILNLSGNDISTDTLHALKRALESNISVRLLKLRQTGEPNSDTTSRSNSTEDGAMLQQLVPGFGGESYDGHTLTVSVYDARSSLYLGQVFDAMGSNDSVTKLLVNDVSYMDSYAARHLSEAFSKTVSLKSVRFGYEFEGPNVLMELLRGLSRNRSIRDINFGCAFFYKPTPEILKNLFIANNTLRSFHIHDCSIRKKAMKPILEGLSANYTLTSVELGVMSGIEGGDGDELLQVWEIVRRNEGLLSNAVDFVSSTRQDDLAREAYRKLCSTVSLVEEVMNIQNVSEDVARDMVRAAGMSV